LTLLEVDAAEAVVGARLGFAGAPTPFGR